MRQEAEEQEHNLQLGVTAGQARVICVELVSIWMCTHSSTASSLTKLSQLADSAGTALLSSQHVFLLVSLWQCWTITMQ